MGSFFINRIPALGRALSARAKAGEDFKASVFEGNLDRDSVVELDRKFGI